MNMAWAARPRPVRQPGPGALLVLVIVLAAFVAGTLPLPVLPHGASTTAAGGYSYTLGGGVQASIDALEYDGAGQLIHDGTRDFQYDVAGHLTLVTTAAATVAYTYNPDGSRATRTTTDTATGAAGTLTYQWDTTTAIPTLIAETDSAGTVRRYDQGPTGTEALTSRISTGTRTDYLNPDLLGSIDSVIATNGTPITTTRYSPWGLIDTQTRTGSAPAIPIAFTGQQLDPTTGLYDLRARMYDPATSRFTTPDPLSTTTGVPAVSRYAYTDDQPTRRTDPTGLRGNDTNLCPDWIAWNGFLCEHFTQLSPTWQGLIAASEVLPLAITPELIPERAAAIFAARTGTQVATNGGEDVLRHYITREAAEAITKGGSIEPGAASGKNWLTPDRYASGAEARAKLALNKTPDRYFEIPVCRVTCPSAPGRVEPYYGQPGGGTEITTEFPIDISGLTFRPFE